MQATGVLTRSENRLHAIKRQDNKLVISSLSDYYEPVDASGFSIKFVWDGLEVYRLADQRHLVGPGEYLLSNRNKTGIVEIESTKKVNGICISLSANLINSVISAHCRPDYLFTDEELSAFFHSDEFPDDCFKASDTALGKTLLNLASITQVQPIHEQEIQAEFFYPLAEKLVKDQLPIFKQLRQIKVVKASTRKDIYRRLKRVRTWMDQLPNLDVFSFAQEACMSEYHFYRLFRQCFGISPHQYLIHKRIEKAKVLLDHGLTASEVALDCGFTDLPAFSRAFKKSLGYSPSKWKKNSRILQARS